MTTSTAAAASATSSAPVPVGSRLPPADLPPAWRRAGWLVWLFRGVVLAALAVQFGLGIDPESPSSPWAALAWLYGSAGALGLDALWTGVRKRADAGPSIGNLGPGAWAIFASLCWLLAVPAYIVVAIRHVTGRERDAVRESVDVGTWLALGSVLLMALVLTCFAWMADRG